MSRTQHCSPVLTRFLVCVLYHEARKQKKPMTVLANSVLESCLRGTESWREAEATMLPGER